MPRSSLLAIGNELLNGEIRDRNLYTLSRRLTHMGFTVIHAAITRDTPESITGTLHFLLSQEPEVVICSGGLGPTEDDLTLSALAQALDRPLVASPEARALVERQYDALLNQGYLHQRGPEAARAKMARLPAGGTPLPNAIGTAPGVCLEHAGTRIYVLPGVPSELASIFEETVVPALQETFDLGSWVEAGLRVHCDDEADVAAPLREVGARHPGVYLKSLARPFPAAGREGLRVIAAAQAPETATARERVESTLADLRAVMEDAGFRVTELNSHES